MSPLAITEYVIRVGSAPFDTSWIIISVLVIFVLLTVSVAVLQILPNVKGRSLESKDRAMPNPDDIDWSDPHEIGYRLFEKFPDTDPLSVRFTDLHQWVTELDGFVGDPKASNEGILEAIQMAWLEETED